MRPVSCLIMAAALLALVAAGLSPLIQSKSSNPCLNCHADYWVYLDILEGDEGNVLPAALTEAQSQTVTVVLKVTSNSPKFNDVSSITASLASQNGRFKVLSNPFSVGSLGPGQTAKASWQISAVSSGSDVLVITAQGRNSHYNCQFSDSYSPFPAIAVTVTQVNQHPSITLTEPAAGALLTALSDKQVSWTATDEEAAACQVGLFYSTDDFSAVNETIATGLLASSGYTWALPQLDSPTVRLKATITDPKGLANETTSGAFGIDSTSPHVLSAQPEDNEKNVSGSAYIVVRFSEPVMEATGMQAFSISPDPGSITWTWSADHDVMTAAHADFAAGTKYACTVSPSVRDRSVPGNSMKDAFTWSFSTPAVIVPVPSIVLSAPAGGERYYWGDRVQVNWSAHGGTGALKVDLSISANDTAGPFVLVASGLSNTGGHSFSAPQLDSDICMLEATVYDENGMESKTASGDFSIAPTLGLDASFWPNADPLTPGGWTQVNWTASGGRGAVSASLSFKPFPDSSLELVVSRLPRSGTYRWTAPDVNTTEAVLVLNATDGWNSSLEMASEPFTIKTSTPPPPPPPPPPVNRTDLPPLVLFGIREKRVTVESLVTFDASASYDPEGQTLYYIWDFGDGTAPVNTTDAIITHVFLSFGYFNVMLAVGDGGNESKQCMNLQVDRHLVMAPADAGDWVAVSLAVVIVLLGAVGTVYAIAVKPCPEPTEESPPGKGSGPSGPSEAAQNSTNAALGPSESAHALSTAAAPSMAGAPAPSPLVFDREACVGCGACAKRCAARAITMVDKRPNVDGKECTNCGECVNKCVRGAISLNKGHELPRGPS